MATGIGHRHRRGVHRGLLVVELGDLVFELLMFFPFLVSHQGNDHGLIDLVCQSVVGQGLIDLSDVETLAFGALVRRSVPGHLHVFRQFGDGFFHQAFLIGGFEIGLGFAEGPLQFGDAVDLGAILVHLFLRNQREGVGPG